MTPTAIRMAAVEFRREIRLAELEVEALSDETSFLDLEPIWNRLVREADLDHPFLEHAWVRTWWECFGAGCRLRVLIVREEGEPIAIAPLIETSVQMFGIKLRRLGFFYNSHVPRSGFIVARRSADVHAAIWHHLSKRRDWDVLQLCQLTEDSDTLEAFSQLAGESGCSAETWISSECPYIPIRSSWLEYFNGLPAKHRANLRNRQKRLTARGSIEREIITTNDGLDEAMADGMRIEAAAWKGDAGTAIACDAALQKFYSLLALRTADRGWVRLGFLKCGAERIAFDYSLHYNNRIFLLKHGYDPAYAQFSPSQLLLQSAVENAFEDSLDEYEILGDNTEWKQNWTKELKKHFWLFVFSNSFKGRCAHAVKFKFAPIVKRILKRGAK